MTKSNSAERSSVHSLQPVVVPKFIFRIDEKTYEWTYQQSFAHGHAMVKEKRYESADMIFQKLAEVPDRGPRAHIMLAICKAGLSDYKASRAVLDSSFQNEKAILAAALQGAIVDARMGFKDDAMQELVQLVNEHKELPTLCLWLGDMLEANQRIEKAKQCWKLAIKRDRPGGAVALAAQQQLRKLSIGH